MAIWRESADQRGVEHGQKLGVRNDMAQVVRKRVASHRRRVILRCNNGRKLCGVIKHPCSNIGEKSSVNNMRVREISYEEEKRGREAG